MCHPRGSQTRNESVGDPEIPNDAISGLPNDARITTTKITLVMLPNISSMRMYHPPAHADFRIRMEINADVTSARVADPQ